MLVRIVEVIGASDGRLLPVGLAKPILPVQQDDPSDCTKLPRKYISPTVVVFSSLTSELLRATSVASKATTKVIGGWKNTSAAKTCRTTDWP